MQNSPTKRWSIGFLCGDCSLQYKSLAFSFIETSPVKKVEYEFTMAGFMFDFDNRLL